MNFFSIEFAIAFMLFLPLYWVLNKSGQKFILLVFNYLLIVVLGEYSVAITVFTYSIFIYVFGLFISYKKRIYALLSCISLVVCNLCIFKYYSSLRDFFQTLLHSIGITNAPVEIIFPLGLSFYTFASITYLYDTYSKSLDTQNTHSPSHENFWSVTTYLSFFPVFIAGPIMRSQNFFHQFHTPLKFPGHKIGIIFTLLIFGIIKKVIIANYLEIFSSPILSDPSHQNTIMLILALYAYAVQIYCDFSGYINLVTAFGYMIGFTLPLNFNLPYSAKNIKEFWNKWHISLSTFIRDFIYIPLGGNKKGFIRAQILVILSFGLSGMWHGNTLNFLIWGLLHGVAVVFLNFLKRFSITLQSVPVVSQFITFHYVCFCWIFFYYPDLSNSQEYLKSLVSHFHLSWNDFILLLATWILLIIYPFSQPIFDVIAKALQKLPYILSVCILIILGFLTFYIMPDGIPNFIYASF